MKMLMNWRMRGSLKVAGQNSIQLVSNGGIVAHERTMIDWFKHKNCWGVQV